MIMEKIWFDIEARTLHFKQPAGTSRGVYHTRLTWLVTAHDHHGNSGTGECAPLPQLSCDDLPNYEEKLRDVCRNIEQNAHIDLEALRNYPSMQFGIEVAMQRLAKAGGALFDTPFSRGKEGIPINGLVWMGNYDEMLERLQQKLEQGFRCVKLKIGAINFEHELNLIKHLRNHFDSKQVELRVDANGGFAPHEALQRLTQLAQHDIHSIEQPIMARQWQEMARLCKQSPLPIALDEELIGINSTAGKVALLDTIKPQYIILKPSLHGGIAGTCEWVKLAKERGVGSWITSALESNVGLCAIAELAAHLYGPHIAMPQGLGTGMLFTDNIDMPLTIKKDCLWITKNS